jgi:hypothetical protein
MKKNIILMTLIIFMFVFGLQIAEPAAAASLKVVDHGSVKFKDYKNNTCTYTWKTYQSGTSYIKMVGHVYSPKTKRGVYTYVYIQKISKTIVKSYEKNVFTYSGLSKTTKTSPEYSYSKLTAAQCYWRYFRPAILSELSKL